MDKGKSTVIIAVSLILAGCASKRAQWSNIEAVQFNAEEARQVATELVDALAVEYPPARTTFALIDDDRGSFGKTLEEVMRSEGYALAVQGENQPSYALNMVYFVDQLFTNSYRVGIQVAPIWRLDSLYKRHPSGQLVAKGSSVRNGTRKAVETLAEPAIIPPTARPLNAKKEGWRVQVMAGTNMEDLQTHQYSLSSKRFTAEIVPYNRLNWHSLRIGPFSSLSEARPVLMNLREVYGDAFLVPPTKEQRS